MPWTTNRCHAGLAQSGEYGSPSRASPGRAQVLRRNIAAPVVPFIQPLQLDAQYRRLQFVQPGIESRHLVLVLDAGTVVAQQPDLFRQRLVVGRDGAAIADRTEVLARIKAETRRVAQ